VLTRSIAKKWAKCGSQAFSSWPSAGMSDASMRTETCAKTFRANGFGVRNTPSSLTLYPNFTILSGVSGTMYTCNGLIFSLFSRWIHVRLPGDDILQRYRSDGEPRIFFISILNLVSTVNPVCLRYRCWSTSTITLPCNFIKITKYHFKKKAPSFHFWALLSPDSFVSENL
jgi:hypothetical protein